MMGRSDTLLAPVTPAHHTPATAFVQGGLLGHRMRRPSSQRPHSNQDSPFEQGFMCKTPLTRPCTKTLLLLALFVQLGFLHKKSFRSQNGVAKMSVHGRGGFPHFPAPNLLGAGYADCPAFNMPWHTLFGGLYSL
jgi:hypothetical protein